MTTVPEAPVQVWYPCEVCGELRRYPFHASMDDPGCRCAPAEKQCVHDGGPCTCGAQRPAAVMEWRR